MSLPRLRGMVKKPDPSSIPDGAFQEAINGRLVGKILVCRGGQEKLIDDALDGCPELLVDGGDPGGNPASETGEFIFTYYSYRGDFQTDAPFGFHIAPDTFEKISIDGDADDDPYFGCVSPTLDDKVYVGARRWMGEGVEPETTPLETLYTSEGEVSSEFIPTAPMITGFAKLDDGTFFYVVSVLGANSDISVYRFDGTDETHEKTVAEAGTEAHGHILADGDTLYFLHPKASPAVLVSGVLPYAVSIRASNGSWGSQIDLPNDFIISGMAAFGGKLYVCGAGTSGDQAIDGRIYEVSGSSATLVREIPTSDDGLAITNNVYSMCSFEGVLYYAWTRGDADGGGCHLGTFDGTTWTDATVSFSNGGRAIARVLFTDGQSLYIVIGHPDSLATGTVAYQSFGSDALNWQQIGDAYTERAGVVRDTWQFGYFQIYPADLAGVDVTPTP